MPTGEIELRATELEVLAAAETPAFPIDEDTAVDEALRLRHRYLDLRREPMQRALELRHRVTQAIRDHLNSAGFLDIETPILTRSTPEGARDFVVPARMQRGAFYALPQSPQLFKQLLMVAGFERYYQIARCFRDEALRADRQLEFTQLDMEMAFVQEEDVMAATEGVMKPAFAAGGVDLATPFPRLTYDDAIARFGTDRPDMRFGMEIRDLGDALRGTEFKVFRGVLESGGVVRGINAGAHELSRAELDRLIEFAQGQGAGGLVWAYVEEGAAGGRRSRSSSPRQERRRWPPRSRPRRATWSCWSPTRPGSPPRRSARCGWSWRGGSGLIEAGEWRPLWVTDFPLVEWNDDEGRWDALHHPFTSPSEESLAAPRRQSRRGPRTRLRHGAERGRGGWREHPDQPARGSVPRAGDPRHRPARPQTRSSAS